MKNCVKPSYKESSTDIPETKHCGKHSMILKNDSIHRWLSVNTLNYFN